MQIWKVFQSTLPQGERRLVWSGITGILNFNPRSRKGSDISICVGLKIGIHFNPRSRKGSDFGWRFAIRFTQLFQSTLPQGERLPAGHFRTTLLRFQSTLPQGERRKNPVFPTHKRGFQSTLPQGERHRDILLLTPLSDFNPRSRKGSDRNYNQFSHSTFIQNYHFLLHCLPSFIPKLSFPRYLTILCAIFPVRIPHRFYVSFRFAPDYKISVWSAAVPRSTPICSTFVWYLFPR